MYHELFSKFDTHQLCNCFVVHVLYSYIFITIPGNWCGKVTDNQQQTSKFLNMEVSDLLNFSFMSLGNTSSMVIALIFVVLTIILLLVLDYMSKLKLKVAEDEERAQLEAKAQAKAQKKKIKKEKKIEREQLK